MRTDAELRDDVTAALQREPTVPSSDITVTTDAGVVTLSGSVPHFPEKTVAEQAALRVGGVKAVVDQAGGQSLRDPYADGRRDRTGRCPRARVARVGAGHGAGGHRRRAGEADGQCQLGIRTQGRRGCRPLPPREPIGTRQRVEVDPQRLPIRVCAHVGQHERARHDGHHILLPPRGFPSASPVNATSLAAGCARAVCPRWNRTPVLSGASRFGGVPHTVSWCARRGRRGRGQCG